MVVKIIKPSLALEASYCSYIKELGAEERYPYPLDLEHDNFPALINKLEDYSKGLDLPEWLVPNSTFWLVLNDELIGVSHLRHYLNDALCKAGGHIGLGIRPSFRKNGYSKVLLKLTIYKAIEMGLDKIHIHCYKDNIASARMILSAGGVLASEIMDEDDKIVQRYIVNVS